MAGRAGRKALIKVSGAAVAFTSQATANVGGDNKTYQLSSTALQGLPFSRTGSVTVRTTSGVVPAAQYTIYRLNGSVVFDTTTLTDSAVTVSGSYLPLTQAAQAREFSYTLGVDNLVVTAFGNNYQDRVQGVKDANGNFSDWFLDTTYQSMITSSSHYVVIDHFHSTGSAFDTRVWAILSGIEITEPVDGAIDESVNWEGSPDADGNVWSFSTAGA